MLPESNEPSARALSKSVGAIWIMWIKRMPSLLERMTVSAELANIAEVNANDLPDPALHAAATCLGMLVAACMYEHGFDQNPDKLPFEPLPALLGPWRIVSRRIGSVASLFTKTRLLLKDTVPCILRLSLFPHPGRPDAYMCVRDYCLVMQTSKKKKTPYIWS